MLAWVLAAGAAVCLIYFIIIIVYSGIGTSLAVIWLLLGFFLGAAAAIVRGYQKNPEKIALWLPVSLVTLCASGLVIVLVVQILIFGKIPAVAEPGLDYVIVLGAGVKQDRLSTTLTLRLNKAAEYASQNPDSILILSGAQGKGEPMTEAAAMQDYLLRQGIPKRQMILEENSYSTRENIAYSRLLIDKDQESKKKVQKPQHLLKPLDELSAIDRPVRIGLLTSNFHLYRACLIAKKQGLTDVSGIASESDRVLFCHFCFRDCLAILKDRLMGNL